jgi:hypothetical protein
MWNKSSASNRRTLLQHELSKMWEPIDQTMKKEELEQKIYTILIRHTKSCKTHRVIAKAFKPFILIDPKMKAKELADEIKRR